MYLSGSEMRKSWSIPNSYLCICQVCSRNKRERCAFFTRYGWRMHMRAFHGVLSREIARVERILLGRN